MTNLNPFYLQLNPFFNVPLVSYPNATGQMTVGKFPNPRNVLRLGKALLCFVCCACVRERADRLICLLYP